MAATTISAATLLSLSFLVSDQHPVGVVVAGNVCNIHHHEGHSGPGVGLLGVVEYEKTKARGMQIVHTGKGTRHHDIHAWRGLSSSRIITAIPRGGGWNKGREKSVPGVKDAKEIDIANSSDGNDKDDNDNDDGSGAPEVFSSPFLDSFQQEVHEIIGEYRSDVRRIFQDLKDDILQSREETAAAKRIDDQQPQECSIPPAADKAKTKSNKKKRRKRKNRNRGRPMSKTSLPLEPRDDDDDDDDDVVDDGLKGSTPKKDSKTGELVRDVPRSPLNNGDDLVVGDSDQDEHDVLEKFLLNQKETDRPSAGVRKNKDDSAFEKSSKMDGFDDKLNIDDDDDDGGWGAINQEPSAIVKTPINLWNTMVEHEAAEATTLTGGYQVKTNEQDEEKKGTAQAGTKIKQKQKIGVQRKLAERSLEERQRRRRQDKLEVEEDDDDEYYSRPLGSSSLSRRQGARISRVRKTLVVSFALGGLFLLFGLVFKILSIALGFNA
jgi:hypothetical protein